MSNAKYVNIIHLICVYTVLFSILLYFSLCHSDIAHPNIYIFLIPLFYLRCVCIVVKCLDIIC